MLLFPVLLRHGRVLVEEVWGIFQSSVGLSMKELAALTAKYEQFCFCATFSDRGFSTACAIKPWRQKLNAMSRAGCSSSGSTIHVSSPSRSTATTNEWRLGWEGWRCPSSRTLCYTARKSGMRPVRPAGSQAARFIAPCSACSDFLYSV